MNWIGRLGLMFFIYELVAVFVNSVLNTLYGTDYTTNMLGVFIASIMFAFGKSK